LVASGAEDRIAADRGLGIKGVDDAKGVATGVVLKRAAADCVEQHALGVVGRDVGQTVVVVRSSLDAQVAEGVEEIASEEPKTDAQFQNHNPASRGDLTGGEDSEENLGGAMGMSAIVVDSVGNGDVFREKGKAPAPGKIVGTKRC
jgi:hypothetical protein